MIFYLTVFTLIIVYGAIISSSLKGKTANRFFFIGTYLTLFTVQGLRSENIGEDLFVYVRWFKLFTDLGWKNSFSYDYTGFYAEPGYISFNLIIQEISKNPQAFIVGTSAVILFLHLFFIYKNSEYLVDSIILFIGTNAFTNSMTALRQFLAMGFAFWIVPCLLKLGELDPKRPLLNMGKNNSSLIIPSFRFFKIESITNKTKEYVKCFACAFLAFNFHQSSLVFVVVALGLWFLTRFGTKGVLKFVFIGCISSIFLLPRLLNIFLNLFPKYSIYFSSKGSADYNIGKLKILIVGIEVLLVVYYYLRVDLHNRKNTLFALLVCMSAYIGIMGNYVPHIFRFGYYFDLFLVLFIPILIHSDKYSEYIVGKVLLYFGSFALYSYYLATNAAGIVPYELCF